MTPHHPYWNHERNLGQLRDAAQVACVDCAVAHPAAFVAVWIPGVALGGVLNGAALPNSQQVDRIAVVVGSAKRTATSRPRVWCDSSAPEGQRHDV
jgi:hypothetical protein